MDRSGLTKIGRYITLAGVALTIAAFALGSFSLGIGALVGAALAIGNWHSMLWLGDRLMKSNDRGRALWGILLASKLAILLALVWLILTVGLVNPVGFAIGLGALLIGVVFSALHVALFPAKES